MILFRIGARVFLITPLCNSNVQLQALAWAGGIWGYRLWICHKESGHPFY